MATKKGLMKKFIKLAGGDFKKAWKLQKAAKGKKAPRKKTVKKKTARKKTVRKRPAEKKVKRKKITPKRKVVGVMAKKRRKSNTSRRRRTGGGRVNIQKILMMGGAAAAGAVGAGAVANMVPLPDPKMKAALPIVAGIALGMSKMGRQELFAMASVGMVSAGALALVRQFAPNVPLLAGEDETLLDYVPAEDEDVALLGYDEDDEDLYGASVDMDGENVEVGYNDEDEEIDIMDGEFVTTADI